jgi:hypothetical protein
MTTDTGHEHSAADRDSAPGPTTWDWRKVNGRNFIGAVGQQGNCQSSAAFAVTRAMNARLRVQTNIAVGERDDRLTPDLSPGDVFFCGGGKCDTGQTAVSALDYVAKQGVVPASWIPYSANDPECQRNRGGMQLGVSQISGYQAISGAAGFLASAIRSGGPLVAAFTVHEDFLSYKGKVYHWDRTSPAKFVQTVCVIGYDLIAGAWLCQNSWGSTWGPLQGYFYIGIGECGIDDQMWEITGFTKTYPYGSATGKPAICIYSGQLHVFSCDANHQSFDLIKVGSAPWPPRAREQWIDRGVEVFDGLTAVDYDRYHQLHIAYRFKDGSIWDNFYDPGDIRHPGGWNDQALNGTSQGAKTNAPLAAGDPKAFVFDGDQLQFCYRDTSANIQTILYINGEWRSAPLTGLGGRTAGPSAAGDPKVVLYNGPLHICYRDSPNDPEGKGDLQDLYYDKVQWRVQQLTGGKMTTGPKAVGDPAPVIYANQMHVCYRDAAGEIFDAYFDPDRGWSAQRLWGSGITVLAAGDPAVTVYLDQMHVCYRDAQGNIWDIYYSGQWRTQQVTGPDSLTNGPSAASDPVVAWYSYQDADGTTHNQMHVVYRDANSNLRDAFYDDHTSTWQQVPI